ncbi:MAG: VOC family protein [Nitrososphaerota archaeon]|nr:VOC family protein [Nitrososphaerota archaeon]
MRIGPPTLRVKDLDRMLEFYEDIFGLKLNSRNREDSPELGFNQEFDKCTSTQRTNHVSSTIAMIDKS